jgi:hypothetical protein
MAQLGRVYALFTMFYLLGFYAVLSRRWLLSVFCIAALFWCHNLSFVFVPALFIIALFVYPKDWKKVFLIFFISALSFIPWLQVALTQATKSIPYFQPLNYETFISSFIFALFGSSMPNWAMLIGSFEVLILIFGVAVIPIAVWIYRDMRKDIGALKGNRINTSIWVANWKANKSKTWNSLTPIQSKRILFFAFAIPLILLIFFSLFVQNIIIVRAFYPLMIPLLMWLIVIYLIPRVNILRAIICGIGVFTLIAGAINWAPFQPGQDFKSLEYLVSEWRTEGDLSPLPKNINYFQPGDAFFHNIGWTAILFKYYFPGKPNYLMNGNDVLGLQSNRDN